ncbi:MAG: hypothetical protein M1595_04570 [Candidatus Thermoplasmatota archaeon]|jgi:hypothetical protein|nr:hypothetical protein [Candidatus Thermoplasmatota archaeon]
MMDPSPFFIIDASNMALSLNDGKGHLAIIRKGIDSLKRELPSSRIIAIADASLKHRVDDKERFEDMLKCRDVYQVPAGTSADYYIEKVALKANEDLMKVLLVSNDQFKGRKIEKFERLKFLVVTINDSPEIFFYPDPKSIVG